MRIVPYSGEHYPRLEAAVRGSGAAPSLLHRGFVDWYYGSRDWCRLLLRFDEAGELDAAIGIEQLRFDYRGTEMTVAAASNFVAFSPGAGGLMFLHWLRSCDTALVFGGSADTHRLLASQPQRWTYFRAIHTYRLNGRLAPRRGRRGWRGVAAALRRRVGPYVHPARALAALTAARQVPAIRAEEIDDIGAAALPAPPSAFSFRLAPTLEYLRWRYDPTLPFVRYRMFRLTDDAGGACGYVILNDQPEQILVAQADGRDAAVLAGGILAAVASIARSADPRRAVVLTAAHPLMQRVFLAAGFVADASDRPFVLGAGRTRLAVDADTSGWLVNYDWIDNGLRF